MTSEILPLLFCRRNRGSGNRAWGPASARVSTATMFQARGSQPRSVQNNQKRTSGSRVWKNCQDCLPQSRRSRRWLLTDKAESPFGDVICLLVHVLIQKGIATIVPGYRHVRQLALNKHFTSNWYLRSKTLYVFVSICQSSSGRTFCCSSKSHIPPVTHTRIAPGVVI